MKNKKWKTFNKNSFENYTKLINVSKVSGSDFLITKTKKEQEKKNNNISCEYPTICLLKNGYPYPTDI